VYTLTRIAFLTSFVALVSASSTLAQATRKLNLPFEWNQTDLDGIRSVGRDLSGKKLAEIESKLAKARDLALLELQLQKIQWLILDGQLSLAKQKLDQTLPIYESKIGSTDQSRNQHAMLLGIQGMLAEHFGQFEDAIKSFQSRLNLREKEYPTTRFPKGHSHVAWSYYLKGVVHLRISEYEAALGDLRQAEEMFDFLLASDSNNPSLRTGLSLTHYRLGQSSLRQGFPEKAIPEFTKAIEVLQVKESELALLRLARFREDLAESQLLTGQSELARNTLDSAIRSRERLPKQIQSLQTPFEMAQTLTLRSRVYRHLGKPKEALEFGQKALEFYPTDAQVGGPAMIRLLVHLADLSDQLRQPSAAQSYLHQATIVGRLWYPANFFPEDGHPDLALIKFASQRMSEKQERYDEALRSLELGLQSYQRSLIDLVQYGSSEHIAFFYSDLASLHDRWLEDTAHMKSQTKVTYAVSWEQKSMQSRLMEEDARFRRVLQLLNSQSTQAQRIRLRQQFVTSAVSLLARSSHESTSLKQHLKLAEKFRENLKQLNLDTVQGSRWSEPVKPRVLAEVLPENSAFIDFFGYKTSRGETDALRFAVFVTTPKKEPVRLEITEGERVEQLIQGWRCALTTGEPFLEMPELLEKLWRPIADQIPASTSLIYLSGDRGIHDCPFSILPFGTGDRILLDQTAIALVPNGFWLAMNLREPVTKNDRDNRLIIDRPRPNMEEIPPELVMENSVVQIDELRKLSLTAPVVLGPNASAIEQLRQIGAANYLINYRAPEYIETPFARRSGSLGWSFLHEEMDLIRPLQDPLRETSFTYTSVKTRPGSDNTVLPNQKYSARLLLNKRLDQLKVAVLDADGQGPEGPCNSINVRGAAHAFHIAGCPNVISSFWKTDEEVARLLMNEFHLRLWGKQMSPVEALRQAQLHLYRHPELLKGSINKLGPPNLNETDEPIEVPTRRLDPNLWGGFALSGIGR
jgi:CHAT domain-containing protein